MTAFCYRFNHFVPQAWLGCGFEIESELTILKTEHPSEWYPSFIENLGLKFAHELDGKTWGTCPGRRRASAVFLPVRFAVVPRDGGG